MTVSSLSEITSFKWATVTGTNPIAIRLDGDSTPLALIPESLVDPLELLVGDRVRVELSIRKCVIHGPANGGGQSGEVKMTAAAAAPRGWMLCQGQSLLRSAYPRLFAAIGTAYGAADATHFSLPDMRGRVAAGLDTTQTEFATLGKTGGEKAHVLTTAEMPSHNHGPLRVNGSTTLNLGNAASGSGTFGLSTSAGSTIDVPNTGGGGAHNILQPYATFNFIIKI